MRKICSSKNTEVVCTDLPGAGGACHNYQVTTIPIPDYIPGTNSNHLVIETISFQNGPILENGVNGCQNEDLLEIVADRLRSFQAGNFSCRENALALTKIEEAIMWLHKRTAERVQRGVEGKNIT